MVGAQWLHTRYRKVVFLPSWLVVYLIALVGSVLETMNGHTCPPSASGFPMCCASLAICAGILVLFFLNERRALGKM